MKQLHRWYLDQRDWVVLDRDSPHPCKSGPTRREMRRMQRHWVTMPRGSPADNPVETIFSNIQLMVLNNGNNPDVKTTQRRIGRHSLGQREWPSGWPADRRHNPGRLGPRQRRLGGDPAVAQPAISSKGQGS
jgi:hypothetical protein